MLQEHIEIVHTGSGTLDLYKKQGPRQKAIADRISELERTIGVTYIMGFLNDEIPDLPKDTPIRVGGGMWDMCVQWRVEYLRKAGYTNVRPDKQISFSVEDALLDAGLIISKNRGYDFSVI
jgi:hypothetical protein